MAPSQPEKDDLQARIDAAKARQAQKTARKPGSAAASGYGVGMKMVLDLVGGALVGLVFGLALDQFLGTRPWGLLILLMLGLVAGFRLMLRTADSHAKRSAESAESGKADAGSDQ